jgi:hypothetical protein
MEQLYPPNASYRESAATAGVSYGYRPWRFLELEAGLTFAFQPGTEICSRLGCYDPSDYYVWIPVGARLIAPLAAGRVELSLGGGGILERYWVSNPAYQYSITSQTGFGGYFVGGVAVAIDKRRRWWAGTTERVLLVNPEFTRHRWLQLGGEVSWRF